jgi:co-chaperonin GroES (HSP10)
MEVQDIRPTTGFVVVRRSEAEKTTPGGIVIPEHGNQSSTVRQNENNCGTVVSASGGYFNRSGKYIVVPEIKPGVTIYWDIRRGRPLRTYEEGQKKEFAVVVKYDEIFGWEDEEPIDNVDKV